MEQEVFKRLEEIRFDVNVLAQFITKKDNNTKSIIENQEKIIKSLEEDMKDKIKEINDVLRDFNSRIKDIRVDESGDLQSDYIKNLISDDFKDMSETLIGQIQQILNSGSKKKWKKY